MSFVIISPVKNEADCIEETLKSMVAQTARPLEWVIVNDHSTDRTAEIIKPYAEEYDFIRLVNNRDQQRRDMATRIHAIEFGIDSLTTENYAYIGILDGDIKLDSDYYEKMLAKLAADNTLGLVGGALYEKIGEQFVDQRIHEDSVAGGVQLFRRECYETIGGLTPMPKGGTDSLAEVMVRMAGWRTRTFSDTPFYHLRPLNAETGTFFYGKFQLGERDYMIGNHPFFQLFRCAYRIRERPYVISSVIRLFGYCWQWMRRSKRYFPDAAVQFKQAEQLQRLRSLFSRQGNAHKERAATSSPLSPGSPNRGQTMTTKRVLMVLYKYFHEDPRPQREAAALVRNGYEIDVICPNPAPGPYLEREHMRFFGPVMSRKRGSKLRYMFEYGMFLAYVFVVTIGLQIKNHYCFLQIFVMPEVLMLGGLVPKLLGTKVLMDWEDPSTEVYLAKFDDRGTSRLLKVIACFERISLAIAHKVIVPNVGFTKAFAKRGLPVGKIAVVMNGVDTALFGDADASLQHRDSQGRFVMFYNGSIIHRHGLHVLLAAMPKIVAAGGNDILLRIIGHGEPEYIASCRQQIRALELEDHVEWLDHVNIKEIPGLVATSSVGVIPNLENAFTRINFPQRIFEFAVLKKPLVLARMDGIKDYLSEDDVTFFTPEDIDDLAAKLIQLWESREHYETAALRLNATCRALTWEDHYLNIVSELTVKESV